LTGKWPTPLTRVIISSLVIIAPHVIIGWAIALRYPLAAARAAAAAVGSRACSCLRLRVPAALLHGLLQRVECACLDRDEVAKPWDGHTRASDG